MPTFYPSHDNPAGANLDPFTRGYLGTAEWLAKVWQDGREDPDLTSEERDRCRGFTRKAIAEARRDCRAFLKANRADLAEYRELSGRDDESAGTDYWLSRNGHGAGFFDRGHDPVFKRLQESARLDGGRECVLYRNRLIFESC